MKNYYGFILLLAMCSPAVFANGSSERFSRLENFHSVSLECGAEVYIEKADNYDVKASGDSGDIDKLDMYVRQGVLHIRLKNNFGIFFMSSQDIRVSVKTPHLENLTTSGSGNIFVKDRFKSREVSVKLTGSGNAEADWECESMEIRLSGSGDLKTHSKAEYLDVVQTGSGRLEISGVTRSAEIKLTGSGDFKGERWKTEEMDAVLTGSGNADFTVTENLSVITTGSGDIRYKTDGNSIRSEVKSTGSGEVTQL